MFSARNIIILLIIVAVAGLAFLHLKWSNVPIVTPSPTPTESPDIVTIQSFPDSLMPETSEVRSPDGKMKLIMKKMTSGNNTTYSFSVLGTEGDLRKTVFSRTVLTGGSMEIPPNAWSPDNKYFFITEKSSGLTNYFVFQATGEPFLDNQQFIDIVPLFVAKNTGFELSDVTGWASPTLIYLLSKSASGEPGPTYWLEIPSLAIIRLASR